LQDGGHTIESMVAHYDHPFDGRKQEIEDLLN
jgi:hypothetical protein